ncbi:MAG: hypothetical protein J0J01_13810 [Reyranella sp.]|nr:hypothetical protein [Reyranella sp.]
MNDGRIPYRWQDHVVTPQRAASNLMATALIVLVLGAAVLFAVVGAADPPPPPPPAGVHVATERTPPRLQLAKLPARPHPTRDWM